MTSDQPPAPARPRRTAAPRLLLLGGTPRAGALADILAARFGPRLQVTTVDAGDAAARAALGDAARFEAHLRAAGIGVVVDAASPVARALRGAARAATAAAGAPLLTLRHPPWPRDARDRWVEVADVAAARHAARRLARRLFLTVDPEDLPAFAGMDGSFLLVRLAAPPAAPLPFAPDELIYARGPFRVEDEVALLRTRRIGALVTRPGGGRAGGARILAARRLGLPVTIIHRDEPGIATVETPLAASDRIARLLSPAVGDA
jgi:precorrin-6A/cobalt-precorrin-6A reductase